MFRLFLGLVFCCFACVAASAQPEPEEFLQQQCQEVAGSNAKCSEEIRNCSYYVEDRLVSEDICVGIIRVNAFGIYVTYVWRNGNRVTLATQDDASGNPETTINDLPSSAHESDSNCELVTGTNEKFCARPL